MWITLLFVIINALLSFLGNRFIKFSAFDISPAAIVIIAMHGESVLLGAILVPLAYVLLHPKDFRYLWLVFPLVLLIGYVTSLVPNPFLLIIIYHLIGGIVAFFLQYFDVRYVMFILVNLSMNFIIVRFATALS